MKVLVLYRPQSDHSRAVEEFVRAYAARHPDRPLEVLDVDSQQGTSTASLYDVMQYPAVLVVQNDGFLQRSWIGELPLLDEVYAYASA